MFSRNSQIGIIYRNIATSRHTTAYESYEREGGEERGRGEGERREGEERGRGERERREGEENGEAAGGGNRYSKQKGQVSKTQVNVVK